MSDDDKNPQDQFKELIKSGVNAANSGLRLAQTTFHDCKEPLSSTKLTIEEHSAVALETVKTVYLKRKQYAPQIVGGTAVFTGGYLWLRRGRIAGAFGAAVGAGAAYSVVYDEFPVALDFDRIEKLQSIVFGSKDE